MGLQQLCQRWDANIQVPRVRSELSLHDREADREPDAEGLDREPKHRAVSGPVRDSDTSAVNSTNYGDSNYFTVARAKHITEYCPERRPYYAGTKQRPNCATVVRAECDAKPKPERESQSAGTVDDDQCYNIEW